MEDFREKNFKEIQKLLDGCIIYEYDKIIRALTIDERTSSMLIHHSDRGCQYCSAAYVHELKKRKIAISMTLSGDPLENAIAERTNGIKTEWLYKTYG